MKKIFYTIMAIAISAFTLQSCEDVPAPYDIPGISGGGGGSDTPSVDPVGTGTLEDPYNVAGAIAYIKTLDADVESPTEIYIKGKVKTISTDESTIKQYGNHTFTMVDEGSETIFTAFQVYGPGKKKFTSMDQLKEGDEVIVCGKVINYKGNTPETVSKGAAYVYSINGEGGTTPGKAGTPAGTGTQADPYNVAGVLAYINTLGADTESPAEVYVKGKVSANNTTDATITSYGNMSFTMIDEGCDGDFTAFQVYGPGKKKFTAVSDIKEGDEVIVCGKVINYKGNTPETVGKGAAYVYSINGKSDEGGSDQPSAGEAKGTGTATDPFNIAAAIKKCQETGETATTDQYYVKGIVKSVNDSGIASYGNINLDLVDNGSDAIFKAFQIYSFNGEKFTGSASGIKVGDEVVVKGNLVNYKSDTPETTGKGAACLVTVNGKTEITGGGGESTGSGFDFSAKGYTNAQDFNDQAIDYDSNTKMTFSKADGGTTPKYYNTGTAMRMYGSNTLTISSSKTIKSITIKYGEDYNGTTYYAKSENTKVSAGSYDYDKQVWTLGASEGVLTYTATGGHLRIVSINIEYAASSAKRSIRRR